MPRPVSLRTYFTITLGISVLLIFIFLSFAVGLYFTVQNRAELESPPSNTALQSTDKSTHLDSFSHTPIKKLQNFILLSGLLFTLILTAIAWFLAGQVAKPLQQITDAIGILKAGSRTKLYSPKGITEIEKLYHALSEFVSSQTPSEAAITKSDLLPQQDYLTGLPNQMTLDLHLQRVTVQAWKRGTTLTFLYIDLAGLKQINDTLGHQSGDMLLKAAAERLKKNTRSKELAARLGGDKFVMVLNTSSDRPIANAKVAAERVISALRQPFNIEGKEVQIGCTIGGAVWPQDGQSIADVMGFADEALYAAKRVGRNRVFFHSREVAEMLMREGEI